VKVAIIGHGGHGKVVRDLLSERPDLTFVGYLDDKCSELEEHDGYICGPLSFISNILAHFHDIHFINAIGDNRMRKQITERLELPREAYLTLIHPKASVSRSAIVGDGTVIMANAVVNAGAIIQDHVILNTGAIVEHDCRVESYSHISPNATLSGTVLVEKGVHIGSGATVLPGVRIKEWAKIGAGATVLDDVPAFCTAVGVPAKLIDENKKFGLKGVSGT
jgi:acetyltransferase EpsM